jgi:hypothetical protein
MVQLGFKMFTQTSSFNEGMNKEISPMFRESDRSD